jgi:ubiquitin C-terminal hydrolase
MPAGIANLGSSCYANALLQLLATIGPLRDVLAAWRTDVEDLHRDESGAMSEKFAFVLHLGEALQALHSSDTRSIPLPLVRGLVGYVRAHAFPETGADRQQDPSELLVFLLGVIDDVIGQVGVLIAWTETIGHSQLTSLWHLAGAMDEESQK